MGDVTVEVRDAIAARAWWHTVDVAPGVTTPGAWDVRHLADRMPWPGPLSGLRCLDVGTADGCGSVVVLDEILYFHSLLTDQPLARFGHRRDFSEWWYFNAAGLKRAVEFSGFRVGRASPYLYYRRGPGVKSGELSLRTRFRSAFLRGACSLAVRGDVQTARRGCPPAGGVG